jgi:nitrogen fixation protein NifU and related proteins
VKADLKKLYSQVIKTHNEKPFHYERLQSASDVVKAYNPICGDRFEIFVDLQNGKILDLHFHGIGCAISKASTSVLSQSLIEKTLEQAISVCDNFLAFVNNEIRKDGVTLPEEFLAFSGVHEFPERYDCVTLSWREMKTFLQSKTK